MNMSRREMQIQNEQRFGRHLIEGYVHDEITGSEEIMQRVRKGVQLLEDYRSKEYSYESKNSRMAQIQSLELEPVVLKILVQIAMAQKPEMFTSVVGRTAGKLGFAEKGQGIITVAEILAVLCLTDLFDIGRSSEGGSLKIVSAMALSEELKKFIAQSMYMPPMTCRPKTITNNRQSGHMTYDDCVILKSYNEHADDVCLDTLNIQNATPLTLAEDFLAAIEEEPTFVFRDTEQMLQWNKHREESQFIYDLMLEQGNQFHLLHKVDKRGRIYCQGFHLSYQSTGFKKALIDFAEKEVITGVPDHLKLPA